MFAGALAAALLAVPASARAAAVPLVPDGAGLGAAGLAHNPKQIIYTGDGSAFLAGAGFSARHHQKLRWTTSTSSQARATGYNWINNCKPDCASGTFHAYPVTIRLYRPAGLGGHRVFTQMTVTYAGHRPPGSHSGSFTARLKYVAQGHMYFWNP